MNILEECFHCDVCEETKHNDETGKVCDNGPDDQFIVCKDCIKVWKRMEDAAKIFPELSEIP